MGCEHTTVMMVKPKVEDYEYDERVVVSYSQVCEDCGKDLGRESYSYHRRR